MKNLIVLLCVIVFIPAFMSAKTVKPKQLTTNQLIQQVVVQLKSINNNLSELNSVNNNLSAIADNLNSLDSISSGLSSLGSNLSGINDSLSNSYDNGINGSLSSIAQAISSCNNH